MDAQWTDFGCEGSFEKLGATAVKQSGSESLYFKTTSLCFLAINLQLCNSKAAVITQLRLASKKINARYNDMSPELRQDI